MNNVLPPARDLHKTMIQKEKNLIMQILFYMILK